MAKKGWLWMPHAGHFICGSRCQFKLNTCVGRYIVSTVGEMPHLTDPYEQKGFDTIGLNRLYETMVFKARKSKNKCCPMEMTGSQLDFEGYNKAEDAMAGHMKLCRKWARK